MITLAQIYIDEYNKRAGFSSVGRELELMAPGVDIYSTLPGGYGYQNGTSMAAPHVTGSATLLWQANPGLTNIQVRNILNNTAVNLGDSFLYGNGLVDALKAVNYTGTIFSENTNGSNKPRKN